MPWENPTCPYCGKTNWVDLGDMSDLTVADIDVVICCGCEDKFLLDKDCIEDLMVYYQAGTKEELLETANYERGKEKPGYE